MKWHSSLFAEIWKAVTVPFEGKILSTDLCDLATSSNYLNFNLSVEVIKTEYLSELRQKLDFTKWWFEGTGHEIRRKLACTDNSNVQVLNFPQRSSYTREPSPRKAEMATALFSHCWPPIFLFNSTLVSNKKSLAYSYLQIFLIIWSAPMYAAQAVRESQLGWLSS